MDRKLVKEKSTFGAATPTVEKQIKNSDLILSEYKPIVKCATETKSLTDYQRLIIRQLYRNSHERHELVTKLKKLQFCTYSVALRCLKEQEFINDEQYYDLMGEK